MNATAKRFGCASSVLYVWDHTPEGMRLYEKCGYARIDKPDAVVHATMDRFYLKRL